MGAVQVLVVLMRASQALHARCSRHTLAICFTDRLNNAPPTRCRKRNAGQEAQRAKRVCSAYCAQQELLPGFAPEDQMVA